MSNKAEILIVDDEENTLASLSRAFRLAGHDAVVCDNAARALELARARPFDLILSDVVMPRRDGIQLLQDLKANDIATPVVMMSGQAHIEMAVKATQLGALDFLEKPISSEKLLLTVENALKLKRLESENSELRQRVSALTVEALGPYGLASYPGHGAADAELPGPPEAQGASATFLYRRAATIYGGSNEVQRNIIAKTILGL